MKAQGWREAVMPEVLWLSPRVQTESVLSAAAHPALEALFPTGWHASVN